MNSKIKIAFFGVKDWEKEYLVKHLEGLELVFFAEKLSLANIDMVKDCQAIAIFAACQITKEIVEKLSSVKMITTMSTGFDHIDLQACQQKGILVCNVPHYGDNSVAEYAFALMLDLTRKIHQSVEMIRSEGFTFEGLTGFDLNGKTLGIVGMGNIGQHSARIAKGFEMNVLAFDVHQDKKLAKKLGFAYASLEDLLKNSDIITLHVPYNPHTHHLINSGNINLIKKGAYLINTSRGAVVETDALVKALGSGIIAGAGLDVIEEENFIKEDMRAFSQDASGKADLKVALEDHILMEQKNVIITPHNAFNSREALERILETTVLNIYSFMGGKKANMVN